MKEPDKITRVLTGVSRLWRLQVKTRPDAQLRSVLALICGAGRGPLHITDAELEARIKELLGEL